jgi:hypothetical protein
MIRRFQPRKVLVQRQENVLGELFGSAAIV